METIKEITTDQIDDPIDSMRSELDREALFQLADNIKQNGLINPITVRPIDIQIRDGVEYRVVLGDGDTAGSKMRYEVVAGHRRLSACKIAGLIKIPCVVRYLDDKKKFEVMAAENIERADVDPVDEAIFIAKYLDKTGKDIQQVAKSLRRSVAYVESRLAVGSMPDYMQTYLKAGSLKLGSALALVQITDESIRRVWCEMAVRDGVSVAQAQYWLLGWQMNKLPGGTYSELPQDGFVAGQSQPVMFECAIDGKKYDARFFKSVMIYEGNFDLFNDIVEQIRIDPQP